MDVRLDSLSNVILVFIDNNIIFGKLCTIWESTWMLHYSDFAKISFLQIFF